MGDHFVMAATARDFTLSITLGDASFSASGDSQLVLDAFAEFKELARSAPKRRNTPPQHDQSVDKADEVPASDTGGASDEDLPLPAFLATLKLSGNTQIGTAILDWSKRYANKDTLTSAELYDLWGSTSYKPPSRVANLTRDMKKAGQQGWIKVSGKGSDLKFQAYGFTTKTVDGWRASKG